MSNWFVYLVECKDGTLYCGITTDIERRISAHNAGKGAKYTRGNGPVKLIYQEEYQSHTEAAQREFEIKGYGREKKLNLIK
jgi:putative endonuclease